MKLENWVHYAEIAASVGVIASLVLLTNEVRENTAATERAAALTRAEAISLPFLYNPELASILKKIKAVDGVDPDLQAFMDRYDLSTEHSIIWIRHLLQIWTGIEADYVFGGESPALKARIKLLLQFPDNKLFWDEGGAPGVSNPEFIEYVKRLRAEK